MIENATIGQCLNFTLTIKLKFEPKQEFERYTCLASTKTHNQIYLDFSMHFSFCDLNYKDVKSKYLNIIKKQFKNIVKINEYEKDIYKLSILKNQKRYHNYIVTVLLRFLYCPMYLNYPYLIINFYKKTKNFQLSLYLTSFANININHAYYGICYNKYEIRYNFEKLGSWINSMITNGINNSMEVNCDIKKIEKDEHIIFSDMLMLIKTLKYKKALEYYYKLIN